MSDSGTELFFHLNAVLKYKLTGISQYFLHARMLKHQGQLRLADYEYKSSIDTMKHSDMLVEHILSLGGYPNLQELGSLSIGATADEMISNDLALREATGTTIEKALALAAAGAGEPYDSSAALLRKILEGQQEHIEYLRGQLAGSEAGQAARPTNNREKDYA
jgi:bacterioferritin